MKTQISLSVRTVYSFFVVRMKKFWILWVLRILLIRLRKCAVWSEYRWTYMSEGSFSDVASNITSLNYRLEWSPFELLSFTLTYVTLELGKKEGIWEYIVPNYNTKLSLVRTERGVWSGSTLFATYSAGLVISTDRNIEEVENPYEDRTYVSNLGILYVYPISNMLNGMSK